LAALRQTRPRSRIAARICDASPCARIAGAAPNSGIEIQPVTTVRNRPAMPGFECHISFRLSRCLFTTT